MSRAARLLPLAATVALVAGLTAPSQALAPDPGPQPQISFPTKTVTDDLGNTLLADKYGRALQLRGANLGKVLDITEQGVADMAAAGLTLLRLPIQWEHLEPTQGTYDQAYVQMIKDALRWADEYGLLVMVDWHQDVFGPAFPGFDGIPEWATRTDGLPFEPVDGNWFYNYFTPPVQAAFNHLWNDADLRQAQVDAWTYLADQLKGSPALLGYDLFNEPMAGTVVPSDLDNLALLAGKALAFERTELADMYDRVIAGIRTVDQRSWLWVEPTALVGEGLPSQLPTFDDPRAGADRIGYAPHAYSTAVEEGGDWDTTSGFVTSYESAITLYPRAAHMPVIVGEWGPSASGPDYPGNRELVKQQVTSFTSFASGWAIWYGGRTTNGSGYAIFDGDGRLLQSKASAWRPYPVVLAGTRMSEKARKSSYTLVYRPRASRFGSQIMVPTGFGDRLRVDVPQGVTATVSAPSRNGARIVTVTGPVNHHPIWTVTITPR